MAESTVCVALHVERLAVRRAVGGRVLRTGLGPRRTTAAMRELPPDGPVAMLGVAGGLAPGLEAGDVVVASEVRDVDGAVVTCPAAPLVAGALRRAGLRVHVGPIVTSPQLTSGRGDRERLARTGALAVDMESAVVAAAAGDRPFVTVRVVSDTADRPVWHPSIVRDGWHALRVLRRTAAVVGQWSAAAGAREVTLASPRSFCAGVERAIDIVERALDRFGAPVYVRRQIVHNAHIVADLEAKGAVFVEELDEVPDRARLVFAAHGVTPDVRIDADRRELSVIDATCPLVAKVHTEVRRYARQGQTVFLIGHGDHEEVVGTRGEAPDRVLVVDGPEQAETVEVEDPDRVAYVMQTTLAVDEAEEVAGVLRRRFPALVAPRSDDICYATSNRQEAVRDIAAGCDLVLVVGSTNSSNSQRLVEAAHRAGAAAYLVDDASDVDFAWLYGAARVGLTAGASAPPHLVDEIVAALSGLGPVRVRQPVTVTEDVTFTLPREVS